VIYVIDNTAYMTYLRR